VLVDAGDIAVRPFSIDEAITGVETGARYLLERVRCPLALGGDHTVAKLTQSERQRALSAPGR
jgi:agmatinase